MKQRISDIYSLRQVLREGNNIDIYMYIYILLPIHVNITTRNKSALAEEASSKEVRSIIITISLNKISRISPEAAAPLSPLTNDRGLERVVWIQRLRFVVATAQIKVDLSHTCCPLHRRPWSLPQQHLYNLLFIFLFFFF